MLHPAPVWLQVRSSGGQQSPFYAELEAAQSGAEASGLGIWSKVSQGATMHLTVLLTCIAQQVLLLLQGCGPGLYFLRICYCYVVTSARRTHSLRQDSLVWPCCAIEHVDGLWAVEAVSSDCQLDIGACSAQIWGFDMLQDSSAMAKAIRNPQAEGEPHLSSTLGAACVRGILSGYTTFLTASHRTTLLSERIEHITKIWSMPEHVLSDASPRMGQSWGLLSESGPVQLLLRVCLALGPQAWSLAPACTAGTLTTLA